MSDGLMICFSIKDSGGGGVSCKIINAALYTGQHVQCNPAGTMSSHQCHPGQHLYIIVICTTILILATSVYAATCNKEGF